MKSIGTTLIILGLLLSLFEIAGCESDRPSALTDWIFNWGKNAAWAIRIGFIAIGFVMVSASGRKAK